jgi:hypothetical protein
MDHRSFAVLVLRLTGLAVVATVVLAFPNLYLHVAAGKGDYGGLEPVLLLFLAALLGGLVLLFRPGRVAALLVGGDGGPAGGRVDPAFLQEVALASIGVFLACDALLDGAYILSKLRLYYALMPDVRNWPRPDLAPEDFAVAATAFLKLVIAAVLVLWARSGARLLARRRA